MIIRLVSLAHSGVLPGGYAGGIGAGSAGLGGLPGSVPGTGFGGYGGRFLRTKQKFVHVIMLVEAFNTHRSLNLRSKCPLPLQNYAGYGVGAKPPKYGKNPLDGYSKIV